MRHASYLAFVLAIAALAGCSESNSTPPDSGARPDTGGGDTDAGGDPVDAFVPPTDTGPLPDVPGGGTVAQLVINELRGDVDFVEIYNPTSTPIALDGYAFADSDGLGASPADPTHRTPMAAGITLAPGEHFVVVLNTDDEATAGMLSADPATDCLGAPRCMLIPYGLSNGGTDVGAIVDPATGATVIEGAWPGAATVMPADATESWCRLPDGTGDFTRCAGTPGAANAAP